MININEDTIYYIQNTFQKEVQKVIYSSFSILEMFGLKFYEDKYTNLIHRNGTISNNDKRDLFLFALRKDVYDIIKDHSLVLDDKAEPTLNECNEVAHFLYIIQNLEDYETVSYRLNADDTPKRIIIDLIEQYSLLSKTRVMEIVEDVDYKLIESLKSFIEDKATDEKESIDTIRIKYINTFFEFIGKEAQCLGKDLYEKGYTNVTLEELINLLTFDLSVYLDTVTANKPSQAALDVLSILIITKDNYEMALMKFSKYNHLFTSKLDNVTKLTGIMMSMLGDFNMFLEAKKQKEKLND